MFPPAVDAGELPLTAFWLLAAIPSAHCFGYAFWIPAWKPPAPPQPNRHEHPPPTVCARYWSWSVLALFETSAVALDDAFCVAVLGPEEMFPPAVEAGGVAGAAVLFLL